MNSIAQHFDSSSFQTLGNLEVEKLPLLLIVTRIRAKNKVLAMIPGSVNVDEMMTRLLRIVEEFEKRQHVEIKEEDERAERQAVLREQDEAYQLSLQIDR